MCCVLKQIVDATEDGQTGANHRVYEGSQSCLNFVKEEKKHIDIPGIFCEGLRRPTTGNLYLLSD